MSVMADMGASELGGDWDVPWDISSLHAFCWLALGLTV